MSRRFFVEQPVVGETMVLSDDQAHHIAHVMRFKPGQQVVLFDGRGKEYSAELEEVSKKKVILRVFSAQETVRPTNRELTLAVSLPKGDRQKFLIEKLVELGVSRFVPLRTERSVSFATEKVIGRFEKQVIEACKQCGRNHLMEILRQQTLSELTKATFQTGEDPVYAIALPDAKSVLSEVCGESDRPLVVAIGPEGGFGQSELDSGIATGWRPFSLGSAILRIETAAIAVAAILGIGKLGTSQI